ncbi:Beta-lactamase OXY-2（Beta-lactamase/transpeptidase-like, 38-293&|uniref:class A beta-lactamase n=1 Tax=Magnetospirillum sp. XM-1 TaxID=1663591 RepID=UPI00073DBA8D|nr:class A beta-lactamase [Magnetospirillum sp. XM-1]CUW38361.1 Beta-lactamase OXY-2\
MTTLSRRRLIAALASGGALLLSGTSLRARELYLRLAAPLAELEYHSGGRLGVMVKDVERGETAGHRADERFALCSTGKVPTVAAALARHDAEGGWLERQIPVAAADLVSWSPVVERRVGGVMTVAELCEAALTQSDNSAMNLLLRLLGGPQAVTGYLRGLGDAETRLDRVEPELNEAALGDARDTTTPAAMLATLEKLMLGDALSPAGRARLVGWMAANRTGDRRLRASLPEGAWAAEKTGSGERGSTNDIGAFRLAGRGVVLIAAYLTDTTLPANRRDLVIADVARTVVYALTN